MFALLKRKDDIDLANSEVNISVDANGVVRKYLNGAVWVESPPDTVHYPVTTVISTKSLRLKRVSCSCSSLQNCKFHENGVHNQNTKHASKTETDVSTEKNRLSNTCSEENLEGSIAGSTEQEREESYKKWALKKSEEKKRIEQNKIQIIKNAELEKKERLAQEQENFKKWLENKKKEKLKEKSRKEQILEKEKSKDGQKERRKQECKLRYQLWLKKKEEKELEKQLKEQMAILKVSDERQRRLEENQTAYNSWLKRSTTKQKPVTMGQGLESLRSCVSITYKNPIPWNTNTASPTKPASL